MHRLRRAVEVARSIHQEEVAVPPEDGLDAVIAGREGVERWERKGGGLAVDRQGGVGAERLGVAAEEGRGVGVRVADGEAGLAPTRRAEEDEHPAVLGAWEEARSGRDLEA